MGRKKEKPHFESMEELNQWVQEQEDRRQQRNARRRERRRWLKTAPREETALKYRGEEKPCSIAQYLRAERFLLGRMEDFPDIQGDALEILLVLAHHVLHQLHPEQRCPKTSLANCTFRLHELCSAALDIAFNYRLDPAFHVSHADVFGAMIALTEGIDLERLRFNRLLGDLSIDL